MLRHLFIYNPEPNLVNPEYPVTICQGLRTQDLLDIYTPCLTICGRLLYSQLIQVCRWVKLLRSSHDSFWEERERIKGGEVVGALEVSKLSALADRVKRLLNYSALVCHHMMWRGVNGC